MPRIVLPVQAWASNVLYFIWHLGLKVQLVKDSICGMCPDTPVIFLSVCTSAGLEILGVISNAFKNKY